MKVRVRAICKISEKYSDLFLATTCLNSQVCVLQNLDVYTIEKKSKKTGFKVKILCLLFDTFMLLLLLKYFNARIKLNHVIQCLRKLTIQESGGQSSRLLAGRNPLIE